MERTKVGRVALEVAVIVASILLAFGIDAGWDLRQRRSELTEALASLDQEFAEHAEVVERSLGRNHRIVAATSELLRLAAGDVPLRGVEHLDSLVWRSQLAPTWNPETGAHQALMSSGALSLIRDPELRELLAGWTGDVEEVLDNELLMRDYIFNVLMTFMAENGIPLGRSLQLEEDGWPATSTPAPQAMMAYEQYLEDPRFETLLSARHHWAWLSVNEFTEIRDRIATIRSLLHQELGQ